MKGNVAVKSRHAALWSIVVASDSKARARHYKETLGKGSDEIMLHLREAEGLIVIRT